MKKKEILRFAGSVAVTAIGAIIGLAMMVKSGNKIQHEASSKK